MPIGAPLGTGASAVVWLARHVVDGREFAVKVWRRPLDDPRERELFLREVRQQAKLQESSGHLVTYAWAEVDARPPWIAVEPHGSSLQHILADTGRPPLQVGLVWSVDLLTGLQALHDRGLVHRDVKPANVLVHRGRAKLCDFGLVMDAATFTADAGAGTPRYVAPELLSGAAEPGYRTDVYSAGVTLRDLLGSAVDAGIEQLLTAATSLRPEDRPESAARFAEQLRGRCATAGYDLPVPLAAAAGASPVAPTPPRHAWRARRIAAVAAVSVLLVGAAAMATRPWEDDRPAASTGAASTGATTASPPSAATAGPLSADAALAEPDIGPDGLPVVRGKAAAGRCNQASEGSLPVTEQPFVVDGRVIAVLQAYHSESRLEACAKLVKPAGSPLRGTVTHLALTLCGDGNTCDHDWYAYATDAGPTVVPSSSGCMSWRVSVRDAADTTWLVRDEVDSVGC
jgi:tRNA A-37 threonylcarbamoyl transferase component Bud32